MQSTIGLAEDKQICMDIATANSLGAELDNCEKLKAHNANVIDNLKQTSVNLFTLTDKYKEKCELLALDKILEKNRGDAFEKEYIACTNNLSKCEEKQPSRASWFGAGVISTLTLTLLVVIAF